MSYAHPMPGWAMMTAGRPGKRRGRHHHNGPWGQGGPWGPPPRARRDRGDVRLAILLLLDEQPRHGYEIITELADRSEGRWRPSPGSIYPVLKRLTKEGLVAPSQEEGKRTFSLTPAMKLWAEGKQLGAAVWQVSQLDDPAQIDAAVAVLAEARKKIYKMLAE